MSKRYGEILKETGMYDLTKEEKKDFALGLAYFTYQLLQSRWYFHTVFKDDLIKKWHVKDEKQITKIFNKHCDQLGIPYTCFHQMYPGLKCSEANLKNHIAQVFSFNELTFRESFIKKFSIFNSVKKFLFAAPEYARIIETVFKKYSTIISGLHFAINGYNVSGSAKDYHRGVLRYRFKPTLVISELAQIYYYYIDLMNNLPNLIIADSSIVKNFNTVFENYQPNTRKFASIFKMLMFGSLPNGFYDSKAFNEMSMGYENFYIKMVMLKIKTYTEAKNKDSILAKHKNGFYKLVPEFVSNVLEPVSDSKYIKLKNRLRLCATTTGISNIDISKFKMVKCDRDMLEAELFDYMFELTDDNKEADLMRNMIGEAGNLLSKMTKEVIKECKSTSPEPSIIPDNPNIIKDNNKKFKTDKVTYYVYNPYSTLMDFMNTDCKMYIMISTILPKEAILGNIILYEGSDGEVLCYDNPLYQMINENTKKILINHFTKRRDEPIEFNAVVSPKV